MVKLVVGVAATSSLLFAAGCGSDAGDGQGDVGLPGSSGTETAAVCAWEATPGAPVLTLSGTTPLEDGDVAVVFRAGSSAHPENAGCEQDVPFIGARAPIVPAAGGGGTFTLQVPAPPRGAFEVAEIWGDEYEKGGPRVVPTSIVALYPGVGQVLDYQQLTSQVAYIAPAVLVYAQDEVPANENWFARYLYGPVSAGYHLYDATLEFDPLNYCGNSQCLCWYGDTGYGYCGPEVRTPTAVGQPLAVDQAVDVLPLF
ncbi:MAG: hypothetical protein H6718_28075 [Polyangiaceae bacterium]|nr:hypothetical protein [Polyangiaceae bacterium]